MNLFSNFYLEILIMRKLVQIPYILSAEAAKLQLIKLMVVVTYGERNSSDSTALLPLQR